MRKLICLMAVCLLMAALPLGAFAREDVQSMVDGLPAVEEFQSMDADAQLEAYHKTQAAYDAYMALSEAERGEISGAEETFEALFGHFNSLVMPIDTPEAPAAQKDRTETLLSGVVVLAVVIGILRILNRKKK